MSWIKGMPDVYKGAILTFIILVIIEFVKNWLKRRELRNSFVIYIKLQLSAILKSLDKIKLKITEQNFFDFNYINEVEKNLLDLEQARSSAIYISEKNQADYFDIVVEIRAFINECRFIQTTYYNHEDLFQGRKDPRDITQIFKTHEENQQFFNQKKLEKLVSISDLKNKIEKFVKKLENDSK